jgi:hypothetical protein
VNPNAHFDDVIFFLLIGIAKRCDFCGVIDLDPFVQKYRNRSIVSGESYQDLEDHLAIFLRKAKRRSVLTAKALDAIQKAIDLGKGKTEENNDEAAN